MTNRKVKIIVIGSGISGLASAWFLQQSGQYEVLLLEASDHFGGHANSVEIKLDGVKSRVDTGFLVFNHQTYPQLSKFFEYLGVEISDSEMSFSVSAGQEKDRLEWTGNGLRGVFLQKRRIFSLSHWRMVLDILRIRKQSLKLLEESRHENLSLSQILERHNYSRSFRENYIYPMAAAIWSSSIKTVYDFPAANFIQFCINHSLFEIKNRPQWKTVQGTSKIYVDKIIDKLTDARTNHKVLNVKQGNDCIVVNTQTLKGPMRFLADKLILACHADQAAPIIEELASNEQLGLLQAVPYTQNKAYLHTDASHMPEDRNAWSAWNYLSHTKQTVSPQRKNSPVAVTYWLNCLQKFIPFTQDIFVTLNPCHDISPEKIIREFNYAHPQMTRGTLNAQATLPNVQGKNNLYFAGAWTRYGFHEDGLLSAIKVMQYLGVTIPWEIEV